MNINKQFKYLYNFNYLMLFLSLIFVSTLGYSIAVDYLKHGLYYEVKTIINDVTTITTVYTYHNLVLFGLLLFFLFGCLYNLAGWRSLIKMIEKKMMGSLENAEI